MQDLLVSLNKSPRWFLRPRFALASWSLLSIFPGLAFHPVIGLAAIAISLLGVARISLRLPNEVIWIKEGERKLEALEWQAAISHLRQPPRGCGMKAWIEAQRLLSIAYLEAGEALLAWKALNGVDRQDLLDGERARILIARAWLYHEEGNIRDFLACVDELPKRSSDSDIDLSILKGVAFQCRSDFTSARQTLERALEKAHRPKDRQKIYNNLAVIAGVQDYRQEQLRLMNSAMNSLRETPNAGMLVVISENLAFATLQQKGARAARGVMREAWELADPNNKQQVLEILNTSLALARQANDKSWKAEVYEHYHRLLAALPSLSAPECVALKVSMLRMGRNDGIPQCDLGYIDFVCALLDELKCLKQADSVAALTAAYHDVGFELSEAYVAGAYGEARVLHSLLYQIGDELLSRRDIIDAYLNVMPPTLVKLRQSWLSYSHLLAKISLMKCLDKGDSYPDDGFGALFLSLKEMASLYQEKLADAEAIEAWLVFVDEYMSYHQQMPYRQWRELLEKAWEEEAKEALENSGRLLEKQPYFHGLEDKIIGMAYFEWMLNRDKEKSRYWAQRFQATGASLHHYAAWLREHYQVVVSAIEEPAD